MQLRLSVRQSSLSSYDSIGRAEERKQLLYDRTQKDVAESAAVAEVMFRNKCNGLKAAIKCTDFDDKKSLGNYYCTAFDLVLLEVLECGINLF